MKIKIIRNAVLCVLWLVFVLSLPIYVFWTVFYALWYTLLAVFNYDHLCLLAEKFCGFIDKVIIQKRLWKHRKKK